MEGGRQTLPSISRSAPPEPRTSPPPEPRATAPAAPSRLLVIRIQNAVAAIDHDPGPIDGIMGPKTRRAIRAFEAARKLPVTGKSSPELLREIEQAGAE